MVATRRGVRVLPPSKTTPAQTSDVQATPSTGRVTRRAAKQAESDAQHAQAEKKSEGECCMSPTVSSLKRCTRASRLHSPEQPSTPVGSIHGGDVSDVESCCSAVSDKEVTPPRTRVRRKQPRAVIQEDEISEVESCSSAVSASNTGRRTHRTPRRKVTPESSDPAHVQAADTKVDVVPEAEPCSSAATDTQRVTRSQRKTARTRLSAKEQPGDSELSDTDSYLSSASGAGVSMSARRRATRSRKQTGSIPIHLDEAAESSAPSTPTRRSSRTTRGRIAGTASEPQSCDSEGFESGPTYSLKKGKARPLDSDSEHSLVGSPCSTRSRGSPCSSRTGSGNSSQATRRSVRQLCAVIEKGVELAEEDTSLNDSQLENTVIAEDADCTLLEEDQSETIEEKDDVSITNQADTITEKRGVCVSEEDSVSEICRSAEEVRKPVVIVYHQQRELCEDNKEENTSEMERMQETSVSEQTEPSQSFTLAVCEGEALDEMEEGDKDLDAADVNACLSQGGEDEDAVVEIRPSEEKMDIGPSSRDGHQVFDSSEVQVEAIQVTSSQQPNMTVDSGPECQPEDTITVQSRKPISLLESSEDEEDEEEEEEEEEEERELSEEECLAEERAGPSSKSDRAGMAMDGLFMIDTRPGQEADEHYYMGEEKTAEGEEIEQEEEEQEEFVDEEEEEDDEEASILFASRNPLLKEMSSRIDPGIRVKELGGLYINFDGSKSKPVSSSLQKLKEKKIQDEVMKKSVIGADFEKKDAVPPYKESKHALKLKHREEKQKSTGDAWFNMKAPELTQELKGDLQVLKMRGSLDSKRFYKKNDRDGFPKYFQIGTVVDNPVDFYHSRIPKKDRKRTMVEELLADAEFRHNNKKKYQQIMVEKAALRAGRKNKKKNKFSNKK